jgi:D-glycero-alpha-D-manno-heptose-7-phosphate kinase
MTTIDLKPFLKDNSIWATAPCRIDMGGTLDIKTFYYPLAYLSPTTVNLALNLRTKVRLLPYDEGMVKISSRGFESAEFPLAEAPFRHPLGLMFSVAAYFRTAGIHIEIESASPPRSALGGSSVAAVALIAALSHACEKAGHRSPLQKADMAVLAHGLEESVAGVPCGMQDQLAAAYGGIHAWQWPEKVQDPPFRKKRLVDESESIVINKHILVAYCGIPHESKSINAMWIEQFLAGDTRSQWIDIAGCAQQFAAALENRLISNAVSAMNREMAIRKKMTPEVLDTLGDRLVAAAVENQCGAKVSGAGGGGCIWAIGPAEDVAKLRPIWDTMLSERADGGLLDVAIDTQGVVWGTDET